MTQYDTAGAFEKLHEDPFLPPVPAPRKSSKGWIVAGAIVAVIGIGAVSNTVQDKPSNPASVAGTEYVDEGGLTPAMLVDSLPAGMMTDFCNAYAGIDESTAHALWVQEYNSELAGTPGIPSADALYYEMTSRC